MPVVYVKQDQLYNEQCNGRATGKILLEGKSAFTIQGVFKSLLKFAVDMIPFDRKKYFVRTGEWVHGDFLANKLPPFLYGEHDCFFEQPFIEFFFRKAKSSSFSPYCTVVVYIFNGIFIYTVPFNDIDGDHYMTKEELSEHFNKFKKLEYLSVNNWVCYDSNDTREYVSLFWAPILGEVNKYRVEIRQSDDSIFERRIRKN